MKRFLVGLPLAVAMCVLALVGIASVQRVSAQSSGNPTILEAIADLADAFSEAITDLETTTNTIQTTVEGIAATDAANVRTTPPIFVGDNGGILCAVTNVGDVAHQIKAELIIGFTGTPTTLTFTVPLGPGEAAAGSKFSLVRDAYYCRFTVLDGVRADIRGSAERLAGGGDVIVAAE